MATNRIATQAYTSPAFVDASDFVHGVPQRIVPLTRKGTALERWHLPGMPEDTDMWIKRDDMTGDVLLSGNKVRKLDFLMAAAVQEGADCVVTAGGTQSNHARATVAACRRVGFSPYLVLRDDTANHTEPQSGNMFLDRVLGADVAVFERPFNAGERLAEAAAQLAVQGKKPFIVPVGGSNALGCWGYIDAFGELCAQLDDMAAVAGVDAHDTVTTSVVGAVGSGATVLGLAVGAHQYRKGPGHHRSMNVCGYTVCDSPEFFHNFFDETMSQLLKCPPKSKDIVQLRDAAGLGYGKPSSEELQFLSRVARETGVLLDPTYSNKAAMGMVRDLTTSAAFQGHRVVFVHTGGAAGTFAYASQILAPS